MNANTNTSGGTDEQAAAHRNKARMVLLDTGDNYLLAPKTDACDQALRLYSDMDVTVNEIPTPFFVHDDERAFVYESMGHIIAYGFSGSDAGTSTSVDLPTRLVADVGKTLEFYRLRRFWENMQCPPSCSVDSLTHETPCGVNNRMLATACPEGVDAILDPSVSRAPFRLPTRRSQRKDDADVPVTLDVFVVFNTVYNVAIVLERPAASVGDASSRSASWIQALSRDFPEFHVASTGMTASAGHPGQWDNEVEQVRRLFHKKSFASAKHLEQRFRAFRDLYIGNDVDMSDGGAGAVRGDAANGTPVSDAMARPPPSSPSGSDEKGRVRAYLARGYELSTDVNMRMKANDLYKDMIQELCVPLDDTAMFKKRLAGYLIEFSLQKKRFSDAYYFFGIVKKARPAVTLAELEKSRQQDLRT